MGLLSSLFVFQDDARYSQVVRRGKLRPEKFPYVVSAGEHQRFRLSKDFRKSIAKPRKKHVFKQWLTYEGLIPVPTEFSMVNDFIEQKLDIKNRQSNVTVTLHDVFLMDRDVKHQNTYWLVNGKDFNLKYEITIQRNPCFGLDADIQTATQSLSDLKKGYASFRSKFGSRKVASEEALTMFHKLQNTLLQQFPRRTADSPCPALQDTWTHYNLLLDSIAQMSCSVESAGVVESADGTATAETGGFDAASIFSRARQIDEQVSRWLLSSDVTERRDIARQCEQNIKDVNAMIKLRGAHTEEQRRAVRMFKAAERYFRSTCK